jgi:hypothetical protein
VGESVEGRVCGSSDRLGEAGVVDHRMVAENVRVGETQCVSASMATLDEIFEFADDALIIPTGVVADFVVGK